MELHLTESCHPANGRRDAPIDWTAKTSSHNA
jgi:hypothetical protein